MKVIVAGLSKTGTKTMNAALTELGYNVYDYLEHFMFHYEDWLKILKGKGNVELYKKMYENVDAVVDNPPCYFWKEIHEAFPDAKVRVDDRKSKRKELRINIFDFLISLVKFWPMFKLFVFYFIIDQHSLT